MTELPEKKLPTDIEISILEYKLKREYSIKYLGIHFLFKLDMEKSSF